MEINNADQPLAPVPIELMGGLYTEATPETLPLGASPRVINCDFIVGSVYARPGKDSAFYYLDFFEEALAGSVSTIAGVHAPDEIAWTTPENAEGDLPGAYATVTLNKAGGFSVVQTKYADLGNDGVAAPHTSPFPVGTISVTKGNTMIMVGSWDTYPDITISDSLGNAWQVAYGFYGPGFGFVLYYAKVVVGGANTVNINYTDNFDTGLGSHVGMTFLECTGLGGFETAGIGNNLSMGSLSQDTIPDFNNMIMVMAAGCPSQGGVTGNPVVTGTANPVTNINVGLSPVVMQEVQMDAAGGTYTATYPAIVSTSPGVSCIGAAFYAQTGLGFDEPVSPASGTTVSSGSPVVLTPTAPIYTDFEVGDTVVLQLNWKYLTVSPCNLTVSDSGGNTYTPVASHTFDSSSGTTYAYKTFVSRLTTGGSLTFTVTADANSADFDPQLIHLMGVEDLQTQASTNYDPASTTTFNTGSIATTRPATIIALYGSSYTGQTASVDASSLLWNSSANNFSDAWAININAVAGSGTYDAVFSIASAPGTPGVNNAFVQILAFNLPSSGGGFMYSQKLHALNFPFSIPDTVQVLGFQIEVYGNQDENTSACILTGSLSAPAAGSPTYSGQLPDSDGTPLLLGDPTSDWGLSLSNDLFNNPNFAIDLVASALDGTEVTFNIYAIKLKLWVTPNPAPNINYLKTFAETGGEVLNLVLASNGSIYQEDAINNPFALSAVYTEVQTDTFAQSATVDDREFMAFSNLQNGTDIPRTYTPPNFDRLTQVGPGTAPSASPITSNQTITDITQAAATEIRRIAWGASANAINDSTPGNVLVIFGEGRTGSDTYATLPDAVVGGTIVLSGVPNPFPKKGGGSIPFDINGTYVVQSVTTAVVGGGEVCPVFTVQAPGTAYGYSNDFGSGGSPTSGWFYQATLATMTTDAQVPNLEVGGQFQITGTGGAPTAGYDGTWTVIDTPNAAQLQITSTILSGNVATYGFNLITGTAPAAGQAVTVTGTLNGSGIFNITNVVITSTTLGTFSVNLTGPDTASAAETGAGIISGTIFTFEPGVLVGSRSGGALVTAGTIALGVRKICYSFLTRNGYLTQPSPILTADIVSGASGLTISNLLAGPSNVIARVIHLTAANGGNFYNIPVPVTVNTNGTDVTYTSTWVNDNTSTSVTLSFTDGVLLAADEIDIQGNNLFENIELGACTALVPYSQRLFAVGEQNKVFNFLNWSFDGGIVGANSSGGGGANTTSPAGWTVDGTNGNGGSMVDSPIFGFSYEIANSSGITQTAYGMIEQNAFQDEFQVPIINASTTYSVRVTVAVPTGAASGNLIVDLYSPKFGMAQGTYSLALSSIASSQKIYSGTLLTTVLAPVPNDLLLRVWAENIPDGVTVVVDRVEVFPTEAPNLNGQVIGSYNGAFEQFDRLSGVILATQQNQQPVVSAFVLFGTLYLVKTGSIVAVNDNNTTEPSEWTIPRTISQSVGSYGPYGVSLGIDNPNTGEEWALIAGRAGLFIFQGQQPIKLSEEIQQLWNLINWKYGHTIWIQNDIVNRRIMVGVPMKTFTTVNGATVQNPWIPAGFLTVDGNPATPNCILMLNYKQLNTAGALAENVEIHRSYSGKMIASDIVRKWAVWTIKAPCAAALSRDDTTTPEFLGNSDHNGKIFELVDGQLNDDGAAFHQLYTTAGFVPTETGQGLQLGVTRYTFEYATMVMIGEGDVAITAYPNSLDTAYVSELLPDLTLPDSSNGDIEFPINECGSRLFMEFSSDAVDAGFELSRLVVVMIKDPWSPVRGVNN